jgi:hypothetical protein
LNPRTSEDSPDEPATDRDRTSGEIISDETAKWVIWVVTGIWAGNIVVSMIPGSGHQASSEINGIFMTVVGGAFIIRSRIKGGD